MIRGDETVNISYSFIKEVRLIKRRDHFCMKLILDNGSSLDIPNYSLGQDGDRKDQSRLYNTFVRVLHMYLERKCKIDYIAQTKPRNLYIALAALLILISVLAISFIHITEITNYLSVVVFAFILISVTIYLVYNSLGASQKYEPNKIPLKSLPDNLQY